MKRTKKNLSEQIKARLSKPVDKKPKYVGSTERMISTGSTLLDLAISGGRITGGGIPGGILVEIFGSSSAGKTVLLCEIAGAVQRQGGQIMFCDPEARLDKKFARLFGFDINTAQYDTPSIISEVFTPVRKWNPTPKKKIHGIFADSLAALSTQWEMDGKDQYGMRRAKEFSEELRKTCRILTAKNFLMVCSNQIRQNANAGPYALKHKSPGGEAIGFYSSLRLHCSSTKKIKKKQTVKGKDVSRVVGIETNVSVFKSSVWEPFGSAPIIIKFDYGIDDIAANLTYIKDYKGYTTYRIGKFELGKSRDMAIAHIEDEGLEQTLKEEVIDLWNEIDAGFRQKRKPKER